ncbi:MAG: TRAP transporter large permease subunit [Woeseiaceae bacterium]|nr:TRAP transporter large permease subunit [Woeseiaceae bacterium]
MTAFALPILVLVLLLLRQNLFVILGCATAYAYVFFAGEALDGIILDAWSALNKEVLLSIPLYVLAGNIMARGAIAGRLIRVMRALTGPVPGGLGAATILSCALFAAVTGSGTVTLVAVGAVMYPALLEAGYSKRYAIGALCAAGTLGVIIPPSIPLILYGVMTRTSIADLFLAGILPGVLLTLVLVGYSIWVNRANRGDSWSTREIAAALRDGIWALFMPVLILGGIYTGIFTPTESAAVAVIYALLTEVLIYRDLRIADLADVTVQTGRLLGALFPVLMLAFSLNMFLTYQQIPSQMVAWLSGQVTGPGIMMVGTNIFLLLIGCLMDIGSAILVLAPILAPLATDNGFSALHFGIIMVVNLEIGYLTPPLGLNLIVAMGVFRESFWEICRAVLPFLVLMLTCLGIIAWWPALSLALIA